MSGLNVHKLPSRRATIRQAVKIAGARVYLDVGLYPDATAAELFITIERTGSERRWLFDESSRLASKLLQRGCPVDELADGWLGTRGAPSGAVQGDERIKFCTSILDYVARYLLVYFCGRDDLAHVPATLTIHPEPVGL